MSREYPFYMRVGEYYLLWDRSVLKNPAPILTIDTATHHMSVFNYREFL